MAARHDRGEDWLDQFHPTHEENGAYAEAAEVAGLEIAHWARQVLNRAAHELLSGRAGRGVVRRARVPERRSR